MSHERQVKIHTLLVNQREVEDQLLATGLNKHQRALVGQMRHLRFNVYALLELDEIESEDQATPSSN